MFKDLPQFVPSDVCLSCHGCCRFRDAVSPWRPKVAQEEVEFIALADDRRKLSEAVGKDHYVATTVIDEENRCVFSEGKNNTCRIYRCRPFECRLYPLLLMKKDARITIGVHLSCPYIQEKRYSAEFEKYVVDVKICFAREEMTRLIQSDSLKVGDYSGFLDEIEEVFRISN